ncbi:hypothetical protein Y023_5104 [Burkholderia pseudomallei A79D]|nr:hypothetical protein Y023_5104 [Burkholderia pseudomallei A79D]KGX97330.1 hypothetical protein X997_4787 [Burkholderia pseudomallei A79C]
MHGQGERNEDRTILEGTDGYFADGRTLVARHAGRAGRARVRRAGADAVRPRRRNGPRHDGRRLRARNDGRLRNGARHDARGWNGPGHDDGFRGLAERPRSDERAAREDQSHSGRHAQGALGADGRHDGSAGETARLVRRAEARRCGDRRDVAGDRLAAAEDNRRFGGRAQEDGSCADEQATGQAARVRETGGRHELVAA